MTEASRSCNDAPRCYPSDKNALPWRGAFGFEPVEFFGYVSAVQLEINRLKQLFPSPYLLSQTEEKVIDDILAVLNQHGMDAKQSLELLEQVGRITGWRAATFRKAILVLRLMLIFR
jgi:hypothetical protein